jgi:hypothetical protein
VRMRSTQPASARGSASSANRIRTIIALDDAWGRDIMRRV